MGCSDSEVDGVVGGAATLGGDKLAGLHVILRFWVLLEIMQGTVLRGLPVGCDEDDDDEDSATMAEEAEVESNSAIVICCLSQFDP